MYEDGNQPDLSGTLCKLTVNASCKMSIVAEPTRGGAVYTNASSAILDVTGATLVDIDKCPCRGDLSGDGFIRTQDLGIIVNMLVSVGPPYIILPGSPYWNDCADINRDCAIRTNDLGMLINTLTNVGAPYIYMCP